MIQVHGFGGTLVSVEPGERDGGPPLLTHQRLRLLPAHRGGHSSTQGIGGHQSTYTFILKTVEICALKNPKTRADPVYVDQVQIQLPKRLLLS